MLITDEDKFCFFVSLDTNECSSNPCHVYASCENTIGGFSCACRDGYSGNGLFCTGLTITKTFDKRFLIYFFDRIDFFWIDFYHLD